MSVGVFSVFLVEMIVLLHAHRLEFEVGLLLFYGLTSVLSQCTIYHTSLWLPFIYLLALLLGVSRALFPNISPQNHRLPR